MKKIQGAGFGVRFYRRGVAKTQVKKDAPYVPAQDNMYAPLQPQTESVGNMGDIVQPDSKHELHVYQEHTSPGKETAVMERGAAETSGLKEKALWAAAKNGDLYAIRLLVMEGVDLDARDPQGRTAINIATQYGRQNALKTLLAAKEMRRMAKLGELPETGFFKKFKPARTGNE